MFQHQVLVASDPTDLPLRTPQLGRLLRRERHPQRQRGPQGDRLRGRDPFLRDSHSQFRRGRVLSELSSRCSSEGDGRGGREAEGMVALERQRGVPRNMNWICSRIDWRSLRKENQARDGARHQLCLPSDHDFALLESFASSLARTSGIDTSSFQLSRANLSLTCFNLGSPSTARRRRRLRHLKELCLHLLSAPLRTTSDRTAKLRASYPAPVMSGPSIDLTGDDEDSWRSSKRVALSADAQPTGGLPATGHRPSHPCTCIFCFSFCLWRTRETSARLAVRVWSRVSACGCCR